MIEWSVKDYPLGPLWEALPNLLGIFLVGNVRHLKSKVSLDPVVEFRAMRDNVEYHDGMWKMGHQEVLWLRDLGKHCPVTANDLRISNIASARVEILGQLWPHQNAPGSKYVYSYWCKSNLFAKIRGGKKPHGLLMNYTRIINHHCDWWYWGIEPRALA